MACGSDCGAPAAPFLPRALAEQLRLAEHGDRRRDDVEPGHLRRDAQREWRVAVDELVPAGDARGFEPVRAQHLEQHFAPAGRIRGQQHASRERVEEILERRQRPLGAQVDAPFLRRGGGEVEAFAASSSILKLSRSTRVKVSSRACSSSGARYSSSGASTGRSTSWRRSS